MQNAECTMHNAVGCIRESTIRVGTRRMRGGEQAPALRMHIGCF